MRQVHRPFCEGLDMKWAAITLVTFGLALNFSAPLSDQEAASRPGSSIKTMEKKDQTKSESDGHAKDGGQKPRNIPDYSRPQTDPGGTPAQPTKPRLPTRQQLLARIKALEEQVAAQKKLINGLEAELDKYKKSTNSPAGQTNAR
jgi:hypothetical protein